MPLFTEFPTLGILGNLACIRPHTYALPGRIGAYLRLFTRSRALAGDLYPPTP